MIQNLKQWKLVNHICISVEILALLVAIYRIWKLSGNAEESAIITIIICFCVFLIVQCSYFVVLKDVERELVALNTKIARLERNASKR